jgi:hypothetical protein
VRLSTVLIELAAAAPAPPGAELHPKAPSGVKVGDIVDMTSRAGFGVVIGLLALVSLPFVGLSTPFGLAIGLLGTQMIAGRQQPWLPRRIREHVVTAKTLDWLSNRLSRWASWLERWIKPRLPVMTRAPFFAAVGVGVLVQALGLALPLPIPGSNWVFLFPILVYSLGLIEDDGLLILVAHAITAVEIALAVLFWRIARDGAVEATGWVMSWFA